MRSLLGLAARFVGMVRRYPLRFVAVWLASTLLPALLANVVQLGGLVLLAVCWAVTPGRRAHAVAALWIERREAARADRRPLRLRRGRAGAGAL